MPFRDEWTKLFPWLVKDGYHKRCNICNMSIVGGIVHIKRHASCDGHIRKTNAAKSKR